MDMRAVVGWFNWEACANCKYYPPETGGCDVNAPDDIRNFDMEYDNLECRLFEPVAPTLGGKDATPTAGG